MPITHCWLLLETLITAYDCPVGQPLFFLGGQRKKESFANLNGTSYTTAHLNQIEAQ